MAREQYTNAATTSLNGALTSSATSMPVNDSSTFPTANFRVLVDTEIMFCTANSSNTLTVVRGYEGTTAASHLTGAECDHIITAGMLDALRHDILGDMGIIDSTPSVSADDDYFDNESFSGWTTVQTTPNCTVTEINHRLSVLVPGGGVAAQLYAFMKAKVPSAGDYVQCGVTWAGNIASDPIFGVIIANGATYTAGHQVMWIISVDENKFFLTPWDGYNANGGTGDGLDLEYPVFQNMIHFRLVWESSNHYSCYLSPDGISWAEMISNFNVGSVGTPSHMGIIASSYGYAKDGVMSFTYCRFSF